MGLPYAMPLARADAETRVSYLRRVALLTVVGLGFSAFTGVASMLAISLIPPLQSQIAAMAVILGSYGIAQWVAPRLVFSEGPAKWAGFALGAGFQGVAMGYLLLQAVLLSLAQTGHAFLFVGQAMALVGLSAAGMLAYLMTGPKELSMVKGMLAILSLPMLVLMAVSFVFPIGGVLGVLMSAAFVFISAAGLLYQMNIVLHQLRSDQHVPGAYMITMGLLVLFWNLLVLLMRLQRR